MRNFTKNLMKFWLVSLMLLGIVTSIQAQTNCVTVDPTVSHVNCIGQANGSINLSLSGGEWPYTIDWADDPNNHETYRYDLPEGTYTVTVTDNMACVTTADIIVNEPDPHVCSLDIYFHQASNYEMCGQRNFIADINVGCRPVALKWEFGDGTIQEDTLWTTDASIYPNAYHTFVNAGTYQASLTVYDLTLAGCQQQVYYEVTTYEPLLATINISPETDSRYSFSPNVSGGSGDFYYNWQINGSYYYGTDVNYVFQNTGWNFIYLTVSDNKESNCTQTFVDSVEITGIDPCLLFANLNQPTFMMSCRDVYFSAQVENASQQTGYEWIFGDGNSFIGQTASHAYADGSYTYELWVTDSATSCQVVENGSINISQVEITLNAELNGNTADFNINPLGGSGTYMCEMIDFGDGQNSYDNLMNFTHTYANSGTYNAYAVVSDQNNNYCKDTAYFEVVIGGFCDMVVNVDTDRKSVV